MTSVWLKMSCPACYDDGYHTPSTGWVHANGCGGSLFIDEYARICCASCHTYDNACEWRFRCGSGRHDFRVASPTALAQALSTSSQMVNAGGLAWLRSVLERL
jgi:hypothetical protein